MSQTLAADARLPFEPQVTPDQAFQHDGWRQARHSALKALAEGRLAIIVGESGAGKTLLLHELERTLCAAGIMARRYGPDSAAEPIAPDVVRLVDEADGLDDATLLRLALVGKATALAILPHSVDRMMRLPGRAIPARLTALSPPEVEDFVAAALVAAGRPQDLFSAEAAAALAFFSEGLPGQLNVLGRASLLRAELEGAPRVGPHHVQRAAEVLRSSAASPEARAARPAEPTARSQAEDGPAPSAAVTRHPSWRRRLRPLLLGLLGLALVGALAGWLLPERPPRTPGEEHPAAIAGATADAGTLLRAEANRRRAEDSSRQVPAGRPRSPGENAPAAVAGGTPAASRWLEPDQSPRSPGEAASTAVVGGAPPPITLNTESAPAITVGAAAPIPGGPAQDANRAAAAIPPAGVSSQPEREAPRPEGARVTAASKTFRGTTYNETLGRGGGLRLAVTAAGSGDAVAMRFEAFGGLVGSGHLAGRLSRDGRLVASGTLMMGQNPFLTELEGTISGDQLIGNVRYTRVLEPGARRSSSRGTFRLARE